MKPLHLLFLLLFAHISFAQSLDFISVRKQNGRTVKNLYAGSRVVLQTTDGSYLEGPVEVIRNDSLFVRLYDVRFYPTNFGTLQHDTIASLLAGLRYTDIARVLLSSRRSFGKRSGPSLLMVGGGGYFLLNVLNGALYSQSITGKENRKKLGIAAAVFGLGFLMKKWFKSDGFSTKRHRIVYVNLSARKA